MKFNSAFAAAALLAYAIAAPLAISSPVNPTIDAERRGADSAKADYVYRDVYKRGEDDKTQGKADYVYREVYKRGDEEDGHAKADYVYREVY